MTQTKLVAQTRNSSIEHGVLIAAALAIGCSWPPWIFARLAADYPHGAWRDHWLPLVTALLFATASGCMLLVCVLKKDSLIILASRFTAATIPLALLLLVFTVVHTDLKPEVQHFWFVGFSGIPAVSLALTVGKKIAFPCFFLTVGCSISGKMWAVGWNPWYEIIGELGFALIYSFPFIVFSNTALSIARILDQAEAQTRKKPHDCRQVTH